jgi:hypothetical protein
MIWVATTLFLILISVSWLYAKTSFSITAATVSFLATNNKRVILYFEKIVNIKEDAGAGMDETGNTFFLRYAILYKSKESHIEEVKCDIYPLDEKKWQQFIEKLTASNPQVTVS